MKEGVLPFESAIYLAHAPQVNSELAGYGLPPILDVPSGFSPLVEVYGKTAGAKKERGTYLVQVGGWVGVQRGRP